MATALGWAGKCRKRYKRPLVAATVAAAADGAQATCGPECGCAGLRPGTNGSHRREPDATEAALAVSCALLGAVECCAGSMCLPMRTTELQRASMQHNIEVERIMEKDGQEPDRAPSSLSSHPAPRKRSASLLLNFVNDDLGEFTMLEVFLRFFPQNFHCDRCSPNSNLGNFHFTF